MKCISFFKSLALFGALLFLSAQANAQWFKSDDVISLAELVAKKPVAVTPVVKNAATLRIAT
jgi:hypothetical protein